MGVYNPVPLAQWTPMDVARNIVNQLLDQFPEVTVDRRQDMNDSLDDFVSGLIERWREASTRGDIDHLRRAIESHRSTKRSPGCGHALNEADRRLWSVLPAEDTDVGGGLEGW